MQTMDIFIKYMAQWSHITYAAGTLLRETAASEKLAMATDLSLIELSKMNNRFLKKWFSMLVSFR